MIKVHGGTANHGSAPLCHSCSHATIVRGQKLREEMIICDQLYSANGVVRWKVTSCSAYCDKSMPALADMKRIAWDINADRKTGKVGFRDATSRRADVAANRAELEPIKDPFTGEDVW